LDHLPQDRAVVRRQSLFDGRSAVQQITQLLLFIAREPALGAGLTLGNQRVDSIPAIAADPLIHELP
jgi:hypothetical protein